MDYSELRLASLAIGSLPHINSDDAIEIVNKNFDVPFWPQLNKKSKKEDMMLQFLESMPSYFYDNASEEVVFDNESEDFFKNLEDFFLDYEEIISDLQNEKIEKYGISEEYSSTFYKFLNLLKNKKFAKGQIVGPFTLATGLKDKNKKSLIYDETYIEIIVKLLTLKALWQIKKMREVQKDITPIIFIDEPSISQLGTSAYLTISEHSVIEMIKEIVEKIHEKGGMVAIHCCGKCDWTIPIKCGVDIINLDSYNFSKNLSLFYKDVNQFLLNGGRIAWGIIPTLNKNILEKFTLEDGVLCFKKSVKYLTEKGIDEKLIIDNSIITPSCGAGGLSIVLAEKAMILVNELSKHLKKIYKRSEI